MNHKIWISNGLSDPFGRRRAFFFSFWVIGRPRPFWNIQNRISVFETKNLKSTWKWGKEARRKIFCRSSMFTTSINYWLLSRKQFLRGQLWISKKKWELLFVTISRSQLRSFHQVQWHWMEESADVKAKKAGARLCCLCHQKKAALKRPKTLEQVILPTPIMETYLNYLLFVCQEAEAETRYINSSTVFCGRLL